MPDFRPANARPRPTTAPAGSLNFAPQAPVPSPTGIPQGITSQEQEEIKRLKDATGLSETDIRPNISNIQNIVKNEEAQTVMEHSPSVQNWTAQEDNLIRVQEDVESLTYIESILRGFEQGQLVYERGQAGVDLAKDYSPEMQAQLDEVNKRLQDLGTLPEDGFASFLSSAAVIVGQQYQSLLGGEVAVRVGGGAAIGAAVGAAGGPLAPATSTAGAFAGAGAGLMSHFAVEAFEVEAGNFYADMIEEGVDNSTAGNISAGVGIINAGLEVAGISLLAKPFTQAGKQLFKQTLKDVMSDKQFVRLATQFTQQYAIGVAGETATEVLQENVNIAAEVIAKEFADGEFENITPEEYRERIFAIAEQTFKGMVLLAPIGPGINVAVEVTQIRQANRNKERLETIKSIMDSSPIVNETVADFVTSALTDIGQSEFNIPADKFNEFANTIPDRERFIKDLGVNRQLTEGLIVGGDVTLNAEQFANIMALENSNTIMDHVRLGTDALTANEAADLQASGIREEFDDINIEDIEIEAVTDPVEIAEIEYGLQGMFRSAQEAGMTELQYTKYLETIAKSRDQAAMRQQDKVLKQEEKKLTREYQNERQDIQQQVSERLGEEQVYQSFNGIQIERLDREQVAAALEEIGASLNDLPEQSRGRKIYTTNKNEPGIDIDAHAQLYGYETGTQMVQDLATTLPFEQAVERNVNQIMDQKFNDLATQIQQVQEARKSVHEATSYADVLAMELNALRDASKNRKMNIRNVRNLARQNINEYTVRDVSPEKFLAAEKRAGRKAGIEIRRGNSELAYQFKLHQLLNHFMAVEANKVRSRIDRRAAQLRKWGKFKKKGEKLPVRYQQAVNQVLENVRLKPNIGSKRRADLLAADPPNIPQVLIDQDKAPHYRDMKIEDFNRLYDTVKDIRHKGLTENKTRLETETTEITEISNGIIDRILTNLPRFNPREERSVWENMKKFGSETLPLAMNMDTMLLELDGFQEQGLAYTNLKGRYDRALSEGYQPGQIGFLRRRQKEARTLVKLYSVFSTSEKKRFSNKRSIDGVRKRLSRAQIISVILNSGNSQNIQAMIKSGQFTRGELEKVWNAASKKDWDFAQSIWDHIESFWPEIKQAEERRRNYTPKQVKAEAINTVHGEYRGGYFPIRYDSKEAVFSKGEDIETLYQQAKNGYFIAQHTQRGHTETRTEGTGQPVILDPYVLHSHLDNIIYDLEVGDAITDMWKIVSNKDVKQAFTTVGQEHRHEMLEVWMRDVTTEQIRRNNAVERSLRWLRTGYTISKLAWNFTVSVLQMLGLFQSSVRLGHSNVLWALTTVMKSKQWGENSIYNLPREQTGFMATRSDTYNKDVIEAQRQLSATIFDKALPGNSAKYVKDSFFWMISTMQGMVDTITWMAAKKKGLEDFNGDNLKANRFADRIVAQSQASGIFGERTAVERGSADKRIGQTEALRAFTLFLSYFLAKNNIAIQRTKQTRFRNPGEALKWARDMAMLFFVESMLAAFLYGEFSEDDELTDIAVASALKSGSTFVNGIPIVGGIAAELEGFRGGGSIATIIGDIAKAAEQIEQGEADLALFKAVNNVGGTFLHYPSGQINKTVDAILKDRIDENVEAIHYFLGPDYSE